MSDGWTDTERALLIRAALSAADDHLIAARKQLNAALELANHDYAHNEEKISDCVGAANLLAGQVATECSTWSGYADARARQRR